MSSDLDASTESSLRNFITRQRTLLSRERAAEIERTSLLLTNCAPKLLEQKGLALGNLGVVSAGIGLGGKTCVIYYKQWGMINSANKCRLVELERPAAFHSSQVFPPHTFRCPFTCIFSSYLSDTTRPGDIARIEENTPSSTSAKKSTSKAKKVQFADTDGKTSRAAEGVVYKVLYMFLTELQELHVS